MPTNAPSASTAAVPLCVDLDGTLIKTDLLWESFVRLLDRNPLWLFAVPIWWLKGRAHLKRQIAARIAPLDATHLPCNPELLEFLHAEQRKGRPLVLATASDSALAKPVAEHLGLFREVLASDGKTNLRGAAKLRRLIEKYGERGFDYAGNSAVDLAVWRRSRAALVVNASRRLASRAARITEVAGTFDAPGGHAGAVVRALRPAAWAANLLLFLPVLPACWDGVSPGFARVALGFLAFSLCTSAAGVLDGLFSLDADRQHPTRSSRPFAAGDLPLSLGLVLVPALTAAAFGLAEATLPGAFTGTLAIYVVLAFAAAWRWKRVAWLRTAILAGLCVLRVAAGHEASGVPYSAWVAAGR